MECSWDKGESNREKKLTHISQWRNLKDSDFQQYIATSDSEEEEEDEDEAKKCVYENICVLIMYLDVCI